MSESSDPVREDLANAEDTQLLGRVASGDSAALGDLYDRFGRLAFGLAYRMLGDATAAEDVVQESFIALWRTARSFDARRGSAQPWLMTSVRYRCIDLLRGPRRYAKFDKSIDASFDLKSDDDVWETVAQCLHTQDVRRALNGLPEDQRRTIDLAYFGGLTHVQIAAHMRVPLGTVKGRLRLALEKLRDALDSGS